MKQPPPAVPHLHLHLPGRSWWLLPASALLFAITVTIGRLAKLYGSPGPHLAWDESMIPGRTTARTGVFLALNSLFSPVGNIIILLLICLVLAFVLRKPLTALALGPSPASAGCSRKQQSSPSPGWPPTGLTHALILEAGNDSFPSGHTAFAASLTWAEPSRIFLPLPFW